MWCPLGDFFGTAPGENLYKSLTTGMTKDGYYAYWYMPFAKSTVVELINDDTAAREVEFEIVHASLGRPFDGLGHFHAKWHRDTIYLAQGPLARLDHAEDRGPRPVLRHAFARVEPVGQLVGRRRREVFRRRREVPLDLRHRLGRLLRLRLVRPAACSSGLTTARP